jgi:uncharacterized delta-60 repeat protein
MKIVLQRSFLSLSLLLIISFAFAQAGTLDSSFGVNGKAVNVVPLPAAVAIQKDGKIIVAGTYGQIINGQSNFVVARYNSNGSIDSAFGINGKVNTYFDTGTYTGSVATSILIQPDNKIIVGGWLYHIIVGPDEFAVVRYMPNGSLDSSFGKNGKTHNRTDFFQRESELHALALSKNGEIFAGGYSDGNCIAKYKSNGKIDSSFGINGILRHDDFTSGIEDLSFQKNGEIVTGTTQWYDYPAPSKFRINLLFPDGSYDSAFGNNGFVFTDFNGFPDDLYSIALLQNGEIIAAGNTYTNSATEIAIAKYKTNGQLDSSFGVAGEVVSTFGQTSATANKILVQQDGKIIVSGTVLARLKADETIDSSFGINGKAPNFDGAVSTALQQDQKVITINGNYIERFKSDPITISIKKNISISEGNSGTTPVQFKIVLNKPATTNVFVNYTTKNINAIAGSDYTAASGTLRIKAGKTTGSIVVNVIGDNTREANEKFALVLSNPLNAVLGTLDSATCTIKNDDPSFAINAASSENISEHSSIKLYPNPVKDLLIIQGLNANAVSNISIIDPQGNVMIKATAAGNHYSWNIKQLAAGTYFVKIESGEKTETIKFIKQ